MRCFIYILFLCSAVIVYSQKPNTSKIDSKQVVNSKTILQSKDTVLATYIAGDTALSKYLTSKMFPLRSKEVKKYIYGHEYVTLAYLIKLNKNDLITEVLLTLPPPPSQKYVQGVDKMILDELKGSSQVKSGATAMKKNWKTRRIGNQKLESEIECKLILGSNEIIVKSIIDLSKM